MGDMKMNNKNLYQYTDRVIDNMLFKYNEEQPPVFSSLVIYNLGTVQ